MRITPLQASTLVAVTFAGEKTVNGPAPESVSPRPAAVITATKVERSEEKIAVEIYLGIHGKTSGLGRRIPDINATLRGCPAGHLCACKVSTGGQPTHWNLIKKRVDSDRRSRSKPIGI